MGFADLDIVEVREASTGHDIRKNVRAQQTDRRFSGNGQEEKAVRIREGGRYVGRSCDAAVASSPFLSTSDGWLIFLVQLMSVTWSSPSMPSSISMNAP